MTSRRWAVVEVDSLGPGRAARIQRVVSRTGVAAERIGIEKLSEATFASNQFTGVIWPYGDAFPAAIYEPIRRFHHGGGHICWLGGVPFRRPVVPDGKGGWKIDYEVRIDGLPCWLHLLNEDIGPCSWCSLVEQWGLYFEPLLGGQKVTGIEATSPLFERLKDKMDCNCVVGCVGPLERGMDFRSLLKARAEDDELPGGIAYVAERSPHACGRARIGGLVCPVPKGDHGDRLLASIMKAMITPLSGLREKVMAFNRSAGSARGGTMPAAKIIRNRRNRVALSIGGRRVFPAMYEFELTHRCLRRSVPNMHRAGIRIFKPSMNLFPTWIGPDEYDYRWFDRVIEMVLAGAPDGYLFPHIAMMPGPWWHRQHGDQLRINDAALSSDLTGSSMVALTGNPSSPSYGSQLWKKQIATAFAELIHHIRESWYGRHFVGIHLCYGHASEWIESAWANNRWSLGDWHENIRKRFQRYAGRHHDRWKHQSAHVPTRAERTISDRGTFLDPSKGHLVSLWYEFLAEAAAETLDEVTAAIKQASKGRLLTGALTGYFFQAGRCAYLHADAVSWAVSKYLPLRHLDILESPHGYDGRHLDTGDCTHRGLPECLDLHGKLFINQNDQRTHLERRRSEITFGASPNP